MFGRKYKMDCSGCHAPAVPRLNAVGYRFRRVGFFYVSGCSGRSPLPQRVCRV